MIKQLTEYILNSLFKHKLINTVKYQDESLINAQASNKYYEAVVDSQSVLNKQIQEGVLTIEYNITILGNGSDTLTVQDNCLHIALDLMEYIENDNHQLRVHDYSVISLDDYTDDKADGIRLTLSLYIPNPINLCEYQDNFDEEKKPDTEETVDLTNGDECTNERNNESTDNEITLNPIKLF